MKLSPEKIAERKKEILVAAAVLALARSARKSSKADADHIFNVQIVGESAKTIIIDQFDKSMKSISRMAGKLIVGKNNVVEAVEVDEAVPPVGGQALDELERAIGDKENWTGQLHENPLQNE